jgi:hypothetical protein
MREKGNNKQNKMDVEDIPKKAFHKIHACKACKLGSGSSSANLTPQNSCQYRQLHQDTRIQGDNAGSTDLLIEISNASLRAVLSSYAEAHGNEVK